MNWTRVVDSKKIPQAHDGSATLSPAYSIIAGMIDQALAGASTVDTKIPPPKDEEAKQNLSKTSCERRVDTILDEAIPFLSDAGEVYLTFSGDSESDGVEIYPLRSHQARVRIAKVVYDATGTVPASGIDEALLAIEALATHGDLFDRGLKVWNRMAYGPGKAIYHFLADDQWRVVRITQTGWGCVPNHFARFTKVQDMQLVPNAENEGSINLLRQFLNLRSESDFMLMLGWLLMCFRPDVPCPILVLTGEQGSGKSNTSRVLRALIDPNTAPIRRPPRDDRDFAASLSKNYVLPLDNISSIPHWLSDALASAVTGGAFAQRALYTDGDEKVIRALPRVILNSIPDSLGGADLASRAIYINLPSIDDGKRVPERVFWDHFEIERPHILGALYEAVATGLSNLGSVSIDGFPRMADFFQWVESCSSAFAWEPGAFSAAYAENIADVTAITIEADPLAAAVVSFMEHHAGDWEGTVGELLSLLNDRVSDTVRKSSRWPNSAISMGSRLRRAAPGLRSQHRIDVRSRHSGQRRIFLSIIPAASQVRQSTQ